MLSLTQINTPISDAWQEPIVRIWVGAKKAVSGADSDHATVEPNGISGSVRRLIPHSICLIHSEALSPTQREDVLRACTHPP